MLLVDAHRDDLGRRQGLGHELPGILVPQDHVDLLAVELRHDRLDPRPALAHRGTLGVDAGLAALHRDLGAAPGLACQATDDDGPVVDLGDLHLHQPAKEATMRSAGHDDRPAGRAPHLHDVHLQVLADAVRLVRQLLGHGQHRLDVLAHVEHDGRVGRALHVAGHDLALAGGVLLEDDVALGLAQPLPIHLAGGLRGDAAELRLGHVLGDAHLAAHAGGRVDLLRLLHDHLELGVLDLLGRGDHVVLARDADLTALRVDRDHHVLGRVGIAPVGRLDRLLEGSNQDLLRHTLLGVQLEQCSDEVSIHGRSSLHAGSIARDKQRRGMANRPTSLALGSIFVVRSLAGRTASKYIGSAAPPPPTGPISPR